MNGKAGSSGLSRSTRFRIAFGFAYFLAALALTAQHPILGVLALVAPILWFVLKVWMGSQPELGFGPYHRKGGTAFYHVSKSLWQAERWLKVVCGLVGATVVLGGLTFISTEGLRETANTPSLSDRTSNAFAGARDASTETLCGWYETARGWFVSQPEDHSP